MRKKDRKKKKDKKRQAEDRKRDVSREKYICQECGSELDYEDDYQWHYGFCDTYCGMALYGLTMGDFY